MILRIDQDSSFRRPVVLVYSHANCSSLEASSPCPSVDGIRYPLRSNQNGTGGILHLLNLSSPFTVIRRIILIIVNPVQRMLRGWSTTNIFNKILKAFLFVKPSFTNLNTSSTISMIFKKIRIAASALHCPKGSVLLCSTALRFTMLIMCHSKIIITQRREVGLPYPIQ